MGSRVAFLSGGKDSFYAAMMYWPIDYGLYLIYEAPVASPHIINMGKSIETLILSGIKVIVLKLTRGKEFSETVGLLRGINASEIIAGDVFIEDHLDYMNKIADSAGAKLREPLWGMDTVELAYREVKEGLSYLVIGTESRAKSLLGMRVDKNNIDVLIDYAANSRIDPVGENGEFHTILVDSPYHREKLRYKVVDMFKNRDYVILILSHETDSLAKG